MQLWEKFKPVEEFVERRMHDRRQDMSIITEVEALIKIIPQIEQVIADAKAAEQTPQVAQMISDLEAIIAEVKGLLANPTPTPTTPAA